MQVAYGFAITLVSIMIGFGLGTVIFRVVFNATSQNRNGTTDPSAAVCATIAYAALTLAGWITGLAMHTSHPYISNAGWILVGIIAPTVITAVVMFSFAVIIPVTVRVVDRLSIRKPKSGNSN